MMNLSLNGFWRELKYKGEIYLTVVVHPFKLHQHFRSGIPLYSYDHAPYIPLTVAEALGLSWIFSFLKGLLRILFLNLFIELLFNYQSDSLSLFEDVIKQSGLTTYYFFLITLALDVIFFPIGQLILTEFWAFVIKWYTKALNPQLPADKISKQISTHALSSHVFVLIPVIGQMIQSLFYFFLLYAGLRANLGASKSLAMVILLTPLVVLIMMILLFFLIGFYFVAG